MNDKQLHNKNSQEAIRLKRVLMDKMLRSAIIMESSDPEFMKKYMELQIAVARLLAQEFKSDPEELIMNTNFAKIFSDTVRGKKSFPKPSTVKRAIINKIK